MSTEKHTPTPWREGHQFETRSPMIFAVAGGEIALLSSFDRSLSEAEANAAFIVRACNSHEALMNLFKVATESDGCTAETFWARVMEARDAAALKLAGGE